MSENLHNRLVYEWEPLSGRREWADYGPFDSRVSRKGVRRDSARCPLALDEYAAQNLA
jgi:hypothetical protein